MAEQSVELNDLLVVGKIVKAQGVKGEVKILPFSGEPEDLLSYEKFYLNRAAMPEAFTVSQSRIHGKFFVVKLSAVNSREASESLVGLDIFVARADMPVLPADEFYWHEYIGLKVVTDQGQELGTVNSLMATGSSDILVISGKGQEYLVPAIEEIIVEVDFDSKTLVIAPMPGLLEINDPDAV
jgi:16S rRNA processing protein RimM